jgi:hypothetical protein
MGPSTDLLALLALARLDFLESKFAPLIFSCRLTNSGPSHAASGNGGKKISTL